MIVWFLAALTLYAVLSMGWGRFKGIETNMNMGYLPANVEIHKSGLTDHFQRQGLEKSSWAPRERDS
jgi:hypothetical protein